MRAKITMFIVDSPYAGEYFKDLLNLGGFENFIDQKGSRNQPLSDAAKMHNLVKTAIRAGVENVLGFMTISIGGKLPRKIGLERNKPWWVSRTDH